MIELLKTITQVFTAIFTEWIPAIANADLGPLGTELTALALAPIAIGIVKYLIKNKP